jgi:flagellar hook-basal body complex protein FliE
MNIDTQMSKLLADMRSLRADAMSRDVLPNHLSPNNEVQFADVQAGAIKNLQSASAPSFGDALKTAIHHVNDLKNNASDLQLAYELRDPKVDITQVMVASEKAGIAFTAMTQVRNKFVDAYRDIMNMPI